jgi:hypothetical protein
MADVEAILFPSRRKMLKDSLKSDDGLPSSTNAQESMHCVYYMFRGDLFSLIGNTTHTTGTDQFFSSQCR